MNSPVPNSTEHRTNLEHARHSGYQSLDVEHRTNSRRPLDQPPGTTTETDKDGGRRRRRQRKTETVEDEDSLTPGTGELATPLQLTTPHLQLTTPHLQLTTPPSEHRT